MLVDSLARLQFLREVDSTRLSRELNASGGAGLDAAARSQLLTAFALGEEWRVVSEDSLLVRLSRTPYFTLSAPARARCSPPRESALSRLMRSKSSARDRPLVATGPHLFVDSSGRPALPDPIFAASALEALQSPPALSGLRSEEVQQALQLTLQQMSSRVLMGLVQPPVRVLPAAGSSSPSSALAAARHPLVTLLSELEQSRWDAARLVTPLAAPSPSPLVIKLRRSYSASMIQRWFRLMMSRRLGRRARQKLVEIRAREQEQQRRDRELHCVRIIQASIRARIASHELRATLARESKLVKAGQRIARWWCWRRRVRRWDAVWSRTAHSKSLLHQRLSPQQLRGIILAQALWRGALLRKRVLPYLRTMAAHRARRALGRLWVRKAKARGRIAAIEAALVEASLHASQECARADTESVAERSRVWTQFESWRRKMRAYFLTQRPLPKHWLPQRDRHSGRTYYFNLKSGEIAQRHPFEDAVRELEKQQQAQAERTLAQRLYALRDFKSALQQRVEKERTQGMQALARLQRFVS